MKVRNFSAKALAVLLSLLMLQPLELMAAQPGPELPDPGQPGMTKQQQEQLGLQAMGEVYKQMPVLPDSNPVTQYVQQLGRKLGQVIPPDRNWPYQFHVVQAADINAFALPGGPIFINIGTIQAADNEAELAGVMAHEMSHVYMQHTAKSMPKQQWTALVAGLAGAVLGGSTVGNLARAGIQIGAGTILMKYSRKDEAQADATGAIIMYKAGYNAKAMADFFTKLEQKYGSGGPQFLSDHPNPGNRQASIQKEIQNWPPKSFVTNSPQFASVKQEAGRIKAYSAQEMDAGAKQGTWAQQNRKNGAIPANVPVSSNSGAASNGTAAGSNTSGDITNVSYKDIKPSSNFKQLQQGNISIAYPDNWEVGGDQNSILIAPPQATGQGGIAYGVIISSQSGNAGSLDQATQQLIQTLQQQNPGLQPAGELSPIEANGMQGRSVYLRGNSPVQENGKPVPERDWLVTLPSPQGGLLSLVFVAPEPDFNQLQPTYQKMLQSLRLR